MRIIYNRFLPFKPFVAMNILGIIFCRRECGPLGKVTKNHEYIHTMQQKELLWIGFFIWYHLEWFIRLIQYRGNKMQAYRNIYFEREAYDNQANLNYRDSRKPFAWCYDYVKPGKWYRELVDMLNEIYIFIKEDFRPWKYIFIAVTAIAIIVSQVQFHIYDWLIAPSYDQGTSMLRFPMIYIAVYYFVLIPTVLMHGEGWRLKQWQVWILPALLVTIDGAAQGFDGYEKWIAMTDYTSREKAYMHLVGSFLFRSVAIVSLLCLFRWATSGKFGLYGVRKSTHLLRIYGLAYMVLVPIFIIVSFTPQFLAYYPKMKVAMYEGCFGWENWKLILPFELCYANDFLGVESMFRGAMIIGLARWLGPRTVLPMIITYMCIHLGKPDLELCSSVIGGYLLGILAYRTKHLWGGIIVHLGIAMLFELLGLIH